jgi:hypothetical protein
MTRAGLTTQGDGLVNNRGDFTSLNSATPEEMQLGESTWIYLVGLTGNHCRLILGELDTKTKEFRPRHVFLGITTSGIPYFLYAANYGRKIPLLLFTDKFVSVLDSETADNDLNVQVRIFQTAVKRVGLEYEPYYDNKLKIVPMSLH